ncbi:MAG: tRNA (guanosine(46)-N7)-methyltransferase TrmB [Peptoniphilaceae bacterium]|nr:tRNA (guanosine(46)-N7)-methyltransferase TrmB [Peptoniphilaceae bacterium]
MRLRHKPNAIPEMEENEYVFFDGGRYKGKWQEVFGNDRPIELEIGAGRGDFICKKALSNPGSNFVALEMNTNAFVVASRKILDNKLTNVRGLVGKAEDLEDIFANGEISKIYLNFSTPWPKKRHHKRRLSHKRFLDRYINIIKDQAILELKTDNEDFFDASLEYFEDFNMDILEVDRNLAYEKSISSEYEDKFRKRGMPIYYVRAKFNKGDVNEE